MSFFEELKRRNVVRVGIVYLIAAWLLAQVADLLLESFNAPDWIIQAILVVLLIGFPLALIFAWAFELTPEGIKKEKDVDRAQSIAPVTGRRLDRTIIMVLAVALAYFVWESRFETGTETPRAQVAEADTEPQAAAAVAPPGKSIAVLPFVNMSPEPDQEYFSDGISEEILNALAKVEELKVAGRTSSFAFKGQNQDLRQIGETLGVDHILEGSVRKAGNTVRITAQLIQVSDGFHLWSETFDRELTDVFAIQDEISGAILTQLKAQLVGTGAGTIATARTDSEAYQLYLLAKQRMYERTGPTIRSAAELLDRAIAIDSGYAPAYAQRGIAALLLAEGAGSYGDIPQQQAQTQSKLYLDKALALDPDLAEAWAGLGLYHSTRPLETVKGIEVLRKALAMNPNLMDAQNWLHNALLGVGRAAEAKQVVLEMIERDPLYRPGIRNAVNDFTRFGQHEQAEAFLDRIQPLIPNDAVIASSRGALLLSEGKVAKGLELIDAAVTLQPSNSVTRLTRSFAWMASHQFERVIEEGEEWLPIMALAFLGRTEEASLLAYRRAEELADVGTLLAFLNVAGRSAEAVQYIEERWDTLEALERDFPPYGALGYLMMIDVALAYSRVGNPERFDDAMRRIGRVHERLTAEGVDFPVFHMSEASRHALAGDLEASLEYLERAISAGFISSLRISQEWPALAPLEGEPRYESIQAQMIEHLNAERAALGLEPVST